MKISHQIKRLLMSVAVILAAFHYADAQNQRTITGRILDPQGEGVIGANVVYESSKTGAITDLDGNFSLKVPVGGG